MSTHLNNLPDDDGGVATGCILGFASFAALSAFGFGVAKLLMWLGFF